MTPSDSAPTPFTVLGGEPAVQQLVDRFYDLMDLDPQWAHLRALHASDLDSSRTKLFWFLCGWLGGPDHYIERFGHPRLRMRHMHVPIGLQARDEWLACMGQAMKDVGIHQDMHQHLLQSFFQTADWMRNQQETTRMDAFKPGD